jgi:hypothetical protein
MLDKRKTLRGVRATIGIVAPMLEPFEAAESQKDLGTRKEKAPRPQAPARRRTDDVYAGFSTAGVLVEIEALAE